MQQVPHSHAGVTHHNISHRNIIRLAIPIILANAAVPLLGLVDTAVIGHSGTSADLGAIALGSLIFSFVYFFCFFAF